MGSQNVVMERGTSLRGLKLVHYFSLIKWRNRIKAYYTTNLFRFLPAVTRIHSKGLQNSIGASRERDFLFQDSVVVVCHDNDLNRLTGRDVAIQQTDYDSLPTIQHNVRAPGLRSQI